MQDLFTSTESPYEAIYSSLGELREAFHREGRISDSNAKLDEAVKFLAIHYALTKGILERRHYASLFSKEQFSVDLLNDAFTKVATQPPFSNSQVGSIFGARPTTAFEPGDEAVAYELFRASGYALTAQNAAEAPLDVLNEAFGHHVRDNFRNHIEDAQYMTPPEVVDFMVSLAAEMVFVPERRFDHQPFVMVDPSCGVGSFLTAWRKEHNRRRSENPSLPTLTAIGQDKVERMVRLSSVNLIFSGNEDDRILAGNSLSDGSALDIANGQVDLILTNPPFGAKFSTADIRSKGRHNTPLFASNGATPKTVDSELLFIDRYLTLLRPGGLCLAIVPDGVISAKGTAAYLRQQLARRALLRAVVELPPVTFAQAGTRTKTAVLVFEKVEAKPPRTVTVFFGEASDLGFEVSKRKGVPIKRLEGKNQLPDILEAYREGRDYERDSSDRPITAVWQEIDPTRYEAWTPRQFKVDSQHAHRRAEAGKFVLTPLSELVEKPVRRKHEAFDRGKYFISVLHVIGDGLLDIAGVKSYQPVTPGIRVAPGEYFRG